MSSSRNKFLSFLFCLFISMQGISQYGLNSLLYNSQSSIHQLHPKIDSQYNFKISVSSASGFFSNSFHLNDISDLDQEIRTIDFDKGLDKVNENNDFQFDLMYNPIHLEYKLGKGALRLGYAYRSYFQLQFTEALYTLIASGNQAYVGQTVEIAPRAHIGTYHQVYLGYNGVKGNFEYSFQGKFISGVNHLRTYNHSIQLNTSDDIYQLSFVNDYSINSSKILKYETVDDYNFDYQAHDFSTPFKNNYGLAIDFGFSFTTKRGSKIFANVYDIGRVNWSNLSRNYIAADSISYEGLDIIDYLDTGESVAIEDSIKSLLKVEESLVDYTEQLPATFVFGFDYKYSESLNLALIVANIQLTDGFHQSINLSARKDFGNALNLGLSYAYNGGVNSLGLFGSLRFERIEISFATDQFIGIITPLSSRLTNYRIGISSQF